MQVAALIAIIAIPTIIALIFVCVVICLMQSDTVRKEVARAAHLDRELREGEIDDIVAYKGEANLDPQQQARWEERQARLAAEARARPKWLQAQKPPDPNDVEAWRYQQEGPHVGWADAWRGD